MTTTPKHQLNLFIAKAHHAKLKKLAKKNMRSVSAEIRYAIERHITESA